MFPLGKHQMTYLDKVINDNLFLKDRVNKYRYEGLPKYLSKNQLNFEN